MNKVQGCRFCFLSESEIVLKETQNFYALPTVGSMVEGYLLLNPKSPLPSLGSMNVRSIGEFLSLKEEIKNALAHIYGGVIFFEQGRVGVCIALPGEDKTTCHHAHLHCVGVNVDLSKRICEDGYRPIKISEWGEVIDLAEKYPHYLYYENMENMYFFPATSVPPQYLRFILAEALGIPDAADWRKAPNWENIRNTVKKLSLQFSKR